jgi:hypothetical protein
MIGIPPFVHANPDASLDYYRRAFVEEHFGEDSADFWRACGLLSKRCLFSHTASLGYDKSALPVPADHVANTIGKIRDEGRLEEEIVNAKGRLAEYRTALAILEMIRARVNTGLELLDAWVLAANNLANRAEASLALLENARGNPVDSSGVLSNLSALKERTREMYARSTKPARRAETISWLFDSIEQALGEIAG